jgi:hypothetical protein
MAPASFSTMRLITRGPSIVPLLACAPPLLPLKVVEPSVKAGHSNVVAHTIIPNARKAAITSAPDCSQRIVSVLVSGKLLISRPASVVPSITR